MAAPRWSPWILRPFSLFALTASGCAGLIGLDEISYDRVDVSAPDAASGTGNSAGESSADGGDQAGGSPGAGGAASVGGTSSPGGASGQGGSPGCALSDLDALSDEFDGTGGVPPVWKWQVLDGPRYDALELGTPTPGRLSIETRSSQWWQTGTAPFVHQSVSGDFVLLVSVALEDPQTTDPPLSSFHSGGILLRDPASGPARGADERYVLINVGPQTIEPGFGVIATESGVSENRMDTSEQVTAARLAICRRAGEVSFWARSQDTWRALSSPLELPVLPDTVQAGLVATAFPEEEPPQLPALRASFDFARFARVCPEATCAGVLAALSD